MGYENLAFEQQGGVAHVRLNRPQAANAMNLAMGQELMEVALRLDADPSVRAVLLSAEGKLFSAGGDLASFAAEGDQLGAALKRLTGYLHLALARFLRMRAPLIVAVQGVAAGAGFSLACAGDLVLASDKARFTMAYTRAGLVPDGGASYLLPRLVGLRRTQELMIENRMLDAQEALDWGLVTRVVPHDTLMAQAEALAEQIASGPTGAYGSVKRLLAGTFGESLETQMEFESREIAAAAVSADGQEGVRAFLDKRTPAFKG